MRLLPSTRALLACCVIIQTVQAQIDWPDLVLTEVASGSTLPVHVTHAPDGSGRLYVVEQPGRILVTSGNGFATTPFLDLSAQVSFEFGTEDGALNMVFSPGFVTNRHCYVYYTRTGDLASVVSRFAVAADGNTASIQSEQVILTIPEFSERTLNGGMLVFGPDGYLYVGTGDNGYMFGEESQAQKTSSLWGKILCIDVRGGGPGYLVPPSNPFVGRTGYAPEIWAMGLRNPWRFSFDRATGDLYISDVGQFIADEINFEPAGSAGGKNYGWRSREGRHEFFPAVPNVPSFTEPIFETIHGTFAELQSINGGYVYRGPDQPRMNGKFFLADAYSGVIRGLVRSNGVWHAADLLQTSMFLTSFGEDETGRIYVTDYLAGKVHRLEDSGRVRAPAISPSGPVSHTEAIAVTTLSTGAVTRYTLDGSEPTATSSPVPGNGLVVVPAQATLKVRSFRAGWEPSLVVTQTFNYIAAKPSFSPSQGPISPGGTISISSATPNAEIRYTLDGSEPTAESPLYAAPLNISTSTLLKARAFRSGFTASDVATFHHAPVRLGPVRTTSYGATVVSWSSLSNETYRLQYSPDLSYWINAGNPITANSSLTSYTNSLLQPHPFRGFFRVVTE
jgi:glucose/arabinose dehydrogenase